MTALAWQTGSTARHVDGAEVATVDLGVRGTESLVRRLIARHTLTGSMRTS